MTNFKNPLASIKYCSHHKSDSRSYCSGKKSFGTRALISLILLLGICCNFALTALAGTGGMAGAGANAGSSPANPTGSPMGPSPSGSGGMAGAGANAGSSSSGSTGSNSGGMAGAGANAGSAIGARSGGMAAAGASVGSSSLAVQSAEQQAVNFSWLTNLLNWIGVTSDPNSNDITNGIQNFWNNTGKLWFTNLGALISQYVEQIVQYIVEPIVQLLTSVMVQFAYNPDVSVGIDQFSLNVQDLAMWVRYLSNDLLLLFFILSIWRYWANAAWKGGSMMGAVARIIVAAGATTAWPTIYHYVILISNALTEYLINQNVLNATTISNAVATAISNLANPISQNNAVFSFASSMLSSGQSVLVTGVMTPIIFMAQLLLVLAIGLAIVGSIVVFFTMKVIQIIIIIAAFVFAPFFLCLLVSPDTDSVVSGFIRSFVETSLWTFVWTIFLMMFVFALGVNGGATDLGTLTNVSQNPRNPWFVLFLELGILQAMIQTPGYLSRGKISEAGEFLELFALWKIGKSAANQLFGADGYASKAYRYLNRHPYNPLTRGKDNASLSLGGANALPEAGKQLNSLNEVKRAGAASVVGPGFIPGAIGGAAMAGLGGAGLRDAAQGRMGRTAVPGQDPVASWLAQSRAATAAAMRTAGTPTNANLPGGQEPGSDPGDPLINPGTPGGTGSTPGNLLSAANRRALVQFGSSVSGGSQGNPNLNPNGQPLVQKTSLGLMSNPNPWHDTRGRRMNPVDYLAAFNLGSVRPGKVALVENTKHPGESAIDYDDSGNIRKLKHRKGADESEIGMLGTVAALASMPYSDGKGHTDARALTATNSAVKDAGKWDAPLGRRISWALSNGRVPKYVQNLENDRLEREKTKARIEGAFAYVRGESGNAYTRFLEWKLDGKMDDNMRGMLSYTSANTDATLGGFNLNWESGIQKLGRMGMDINPVTMGIASHEGIIAMKPSEQPQAIPAGLQLVNAYLGEMGVHAGAKDAQGKDIWNASNIHWAAADGVLRQLGPQHFRAARAIADVQGMHEVTPYNVNQVMLKHRESGQGEMAHAYERVVLEYFDRLPANQMRGGSGRNSPDRITLPTHNRAFQT